MQHIEREPTTVVTSLRLTESKSQYIKEKASEIGVSQHAFTLMLIDFGIKMYEGSVSISLHQREE